MPWKPDYVALDDLKGYLKIPLTDTEDDIELARVITAASRAVDKNCGRQFGKTDAAEARRYTARWHTLRSRWVVDIDDLMVAAGLIVTVEDGAITDYDLTPFNAVSDGRPWTRLEVRPESTIQPDAEPGGVTITADPWGWTAVPAEVGEAVLLQSNRFHARRDSPYGIAGSPEEGSELRLLSRLDPDVGVALSHLIRRVAR